MSIDGLLKVGAWIPLSVPPGRSGGWAGGRAEARAWFEPVTEKPHGCSRKAVKLLHVVTDVPAPVSDVASLMATVAFRKEAEDLTRWVGSMRWL
jgi:hypothetical protein